MTTKTTKGTAKTANQKTTRTRKATPFEVDDSGRIVVGKRKFTGLHFKTLFVTLSDLKAHSTDELAAAIHEAVKDEGTPQSELIAIRKLLGNRFAHIRKALADTAFELVRVDRGTFQLKRREQPTS